LLLDWAPRQPSSFGSFGVQSFFLALFPVAVEARFGSLILHHLLLGADSANAARQHRFQTERFFGSGRGKAAFRAPLLMALFSVDIETRGGV